MGSRVIKVELLPSAKPKSAGLTSLENPGGGFSQCKSLCPIATLKKKPVVGAAFPVDKRGGKNRRRELDARTREEKK